MSLRWLLTAVSGGVRSRKDLLAALLRRRTKKVASKPLSISMVHRILGSPYYIGIVSYGGVDYEAKHEPLVDVITFQRVQHVMAEARAVMRACEAEYEHIEGDLLRTRKLLSIVRRVTSGRQTTSDGA